ncbi:phage portal protein [Peribacillus frigoritolerans]|uniref:phage portal protein n=1 Tax=Peribacillus frigoritolerans TaxID=450367 RepID=UPI003B8D74B4
MSNLDVFIKDKYNDPYWFVEFVGEIPNQLRVQDVQSKKEYLDGSHAILNKPSYKYNGKEFVPRKIVLQYAKTLLNFQKAYLLQLPVTLTGEDKVVKHYSAIMRKGKYDRLNIKLLDKVLKYGQVAEYVYIHNGVIKSKIIDASEGFPVYDHENNLLAFVEAYVVDAISYFIVYKEDVVEKYNNNGGDMRMTERYANLSGLPIIYHNDNELYENQGKSELDDWISILDSMEDLISKYTDSFYKFMNPIPVAIGQQLKGAGLPTDVVGGGINLDDGGEFKYVSNQSDYKSFETIYKTLVQSLLDVSQTPAVSMNKTDISNLSEVSIKLLFQLANIKAGMNEVFMREGFEERYEKIRVLSAEYKGIVFNDDEYDSLDMVFQYAQPSNDKEIIENIKTLRELGGMSLESMLEKSPYTTDVQYEMKRLKNEEPVEVEVNDVNDDEDKKEDDKEKDLAV